MNSGGNIFLLKVNCSYDIQPDDLVFAHIKVEEEKFEKITDSKKTVIRDGHISR